MPADRPVHSTIAQAYVYLLVAVRRQASLDHAIEDFNSYWMKEGGLYDSMREALALVQADHAVHYSEILNEDGAHAIR